VTSAVLPSPGARGLSLAAVLRERNVDASCEPADLWACSRDCWPRSLLWTKAAVAPHPPDVVAWPADAEQVAAIVQLAAEQQVAVVPFGAGSGVCGGAVPVRGGIALDLKRLEGPLKIDLPARTVQVGAGMNGQRLEELLNAQGATLGHFPSSIYCSTVGGWLAARSAGQLSSRYGKIEDMVLAGSPRAAPGSSRAATGRSKTWCSRSRPSTARARCCTRSTGRAPGRISPNCSSAARARSA
jgi:FAD/FMN-containing dehydrogenase